MPDLFFDAVPIWNAFIELNSSRTIGFGISSIPYSEITNWMDENLIVTIEERQHFRKFIRMIDDIWVGHMNEKSSNNSGAIKNHQKKR